MKRLIPVTALLVGCIAPASGSSQPQQMDDLRFLRFKLSGRRPSERGVDTGSAPRGEGRGRRIRFLEESSRAEEKAPYNLRARIWKRRNQIELVGQKAPGFRTEDRVGAEFRGLDSLRGTPVVLFFWWESCGDCRAQAAALRRTIDKYAARGVAFVAPRRFYKEDRAAEKDRIERAWKQIYAFPDSVAGPISDEVMLRYGVSATPTFAFVDRRGVVREYLPYRMTEERLSAAIEELLR